MNALPCGKSKLYIPNPSPAGRRASISGSLYLWERARVRGAASSSSNSTTLR
jgi:hypothetical protein